MAGGKSAGSERGLVSPWFCLVVPVLSYFFCSLLIQWILVAMSGVFTVYLRPANQTIMSVADTIVSQGKAAPSLPEGVWIAGAVAVMALLLLAVSLISKGKKVRGRVVRSVCME